MEPHDIHIGAVRFAEAALISSVLKVQALGPEETKSSRGSPTSDVRLLPRVRVVVEGPDPPPRRKSLAKRRHSSFRDNYVSDPERLLHKLESFTTRSLSLENALALHTFTQLGSTKQEYNLLADPLGFIPRLSKFRLFFIRVAENPIFTTTMLIAIIVNVLLGVLEVLITPRSRGDADVLWAVIENIFIVIFAIEIFVKVFSQGLLFHRWSYLRDRWNCMDFIIVFGSLVALGLNGKVRKFTATRYIRIIRMLRAFSKLKTLQRCTNALVAAIPGIGNIMVLFGLLILTFSLVGLDTLNGMYRMRCTSNDPLLVDDAFDLEVCGVVGCQPGWSCTKITTPGIWSLNYENIGQALLSSLVLLSGDNTQSLLFDIQRSTGLWGTFYIVAYTCSCVYIALQLIIAIISSAFTKADHQFATDNVMDGQHCGKIRVDQLLTPAACLVSIMALPLHVEKRIIQKACNVPATPKWLLEMQETETGALMDEDMDNSFNNEEIEIAEQIQSMAHNTRWERFRHLLLAATETRAFSLLIAAANIITVLTLCLDRYPTPVGWVKVESYINLGCTVVYFFEFVCLVIGLSPKPYFQNVNRILDFMLVIIGLVDVMIDEDVIIFRLLRITRVWKFVWKRFPAVIIVLIYIVKRVASTFLLLALHILIFALLGTNFFAENAQLNSNRANFSNFGASLLTCFTVVSNEEWYIIMVDASQEQQILALPFFLLMFTIGNWLLFNLIVALFLDAWSRASRSSQMPSRDPILSFDFERDPVSPSFNPLLPARDQITMSCTPTGSQAQRKREKSERLAEKYDLRGRSCNLFPRTNRFRIYCYQCSMTTAARYVNLFAILASCVIISLDHPNSPVQARFFYFDYIIMVIFHFEVACKIVAMGIVNSVAVESRETISIERRGYFASVSNWVDFIAVLSTIVSVILPPFRIIRVIRCLRIVTHSRSTERIARAVVSVTFELLGTFSAILVVQVIFAIIGVALFKGRMFKCLDHTVETASQCKGNYIYDYSTASGLKILIPRVLSQTDYPMNDVLQALRVGFIFSVGDSWIPNLHAAMDTGGVGELMKTNQSWWLAFYPILLNIVGQYVCMNITIAVLAETLNEKIHKESRLLSSAQKAWRSIARLHVHASVSFPHRFPKAAWRRICFNVVQSAFYDITMAVIIMGNVVVLSLAFYEMPRYLENAVNTANIVFVVFFSVDVVFKIASYGADGYFSENWNRLDFVTVFFSWVGVFTGIETSVIRVLRLLRIVKLTRSFHALRDLAMVIILSLPSIFNIMVIIALVMYVYAVVGYHFFWNVKRTGILKQTPYNGYSTLPNSLQTVFQLIMGMGWHYFASAIAVSEPYCDMTINCGSPSVSWIFHITCIILVTRVMLNMVTAVILNEFNVIQDIGEHREHVKILETLNRTWALFDNHRILELTPAKVIQILYFLPYPLSFPDPGAQRVTHLLRMPIKLNGNKLVDYSTLLLAVSRASFQLAPDEAPPVNLPFYVHDYYAVEKISLFWKRARIEQFRRLKAELMSIKQPDPPSIKQTEPPTSRRSSTGSSTTSELVMDATRDILHPQYSFP